MTQERSKPSFAVRALEELGDDWVFAPERHLQRARRGTDVPLGELVVERREHVDPSSGRFTVVCDTTHAEDGILDLAAAVRDGAKKTSAKKSAWEGDLVVSRLRPYLRQVALVHPDAFSVLGGRGASKKWRLALSTEFYVLAPAIEGEDLAFLLPFVLSEATQRCLADAQEGGHHPRVPRESLLRIGVPRRLVDDRNRVSTRVRRALADVYRAAAEWRALLNA